LAIYIVSIVWMLMETLFFNLNGLIG